MLDSSKTACLTRLIMDYLMGVDYKLLRTKGWSDGKKKSKRKRARL